MSQEAYEKALELFESKNYETALAALLSMDDPSDYPLLSYHLGLCYTQLGRYDEALLYLEQVAGNQLDLVHLFQIRMILGYIYSITDRKRLAEFEFRRLLEEGFESAKVYSALAHALYSQKKTGESIDLLEKALNLEPDNANALNSLGYILADQAKRLPLALVYCQKAVNMAPANPAYLDSLGWALFRNGNLKEARSYLRQAQERAPRNADIMKHLKKVMEALT
jgi:tetratricopeptide (TPR) repeat protein